MAPAGWPTARVGSRSWCSPRCSSSSARIGSGLAFSPLDLIIWRVIGGLGVGAASVIAPAYIAEISPASIRGRMGSLQQLAIVTGIFIALLSDAFLARVAGGAGSELWFGLPAWRWMFLTGAIPALAYGLMSLQIPESPRYLVARGETDKARGVLSQVLKTGIDERMAEIRRTVVLESRSSFNDLKQQGHRAAADRLDRHRPVGLPAVRRHQRDLLLLLGAVAAGRLQRERRADHHGHHVGDEHRR